MVIPKLQQFVAPEMVLGERFVKRLCRVLLLALALGGCGRGDLHVPVNGTVKFSDGSVPKGVIASITFQPASARPGAKGASSTIAEDGSFSLQTVKPGDGALPGDYLVTVQVMDNYPRGKSVVADVFTKASATPLKATVNASGKNRFDFVVERP
jgi:hypothetical protein